MPSVREKKTVAHKMALHKAIGEILKVHSYSKLSINFVSETANVDKAFIYRHYGDFDGLLHAYVEKQDFWLQNLGKLTVEPISNHREYMKGLFMSQFKELYKNEEWQQFLVWELGDKEGFTTKVAIERELLAQGIFDQCRDVFREYRIDLNMIYAIFSAAIYYLILHKDKSTFCEFDFTREEDLAEFVKTLTWLIDLLFDKLETNNKLEDVAIKAYKKGMSVDDIAEITGLTKNKVNTLVHSKIS